jgi:TonB family protein
MLSIRITIFLLVSALIHILIIVLPSPSFGPLLTNRTAETPRLIVHFLSNSPANPVPTATPPSLTSNASPRSDTPAPPPLRSSSPASERFYEIQELDTPIRPRTDIQPIYPPGADPSISGTLVLDLFIDKTGKVQNVTVDESSLPPEFGQSSIAAFLHQDFEPGMVSSVPVKTHLKIKVEFYPDNSSVPIPPSKIN